MSWNCIPYTYLQELEEGSLPTSSLGTLQSRLLKSKSTPEEFCCKGSLTECYLDSLFGTTCAVSETTTPIPPVSSGEQRRSTGNSLFAAGSRNCAKIFPSQEKAQESTASGRGSGQSLLGSFAKYDRATCSWKTHQLSLFGGLEEYSETWPRAGMMRNTACYRRPMLGPCTSETVSGYSQKEGTWPPPTCNMVSGGPNHNSPQVIAGNHGINLHGSVIKALSAQVHMRPTPCSRDHHPNEMNPGSKVDLGNAVKTYPTPTTMGHIERKGMRPSRAATGRTTGYLSESVTGQLNPDWVEGFLMGWPYRWSSLEPMDKATFDAWLSRDATAWQNDPADTGDVPRVATDVENRVPRLTAIGNGQVPQCAAMAWRILTERMNKI